ncbi:conserved hypothetical protein [Listeria seeligeri FSL S4-171]|nr:conserved hypothetical protein [Listeria seeligeri FSL S4-171]
MGLKNGSQYGEKIKKEQPNSVALFKKSVFLSQNIKRSSG